MKYATLVAAAAATHQHQVEMSEIMGGVLESYGLKFDPLALLVCIGDEDKALLAADEAVQMFEEAY